MTQAFTLSVEADLKNLKKVRSFINETGRSLHIDNAVLGDLCLVVDEAVTNVIVHGYAGDEGLVQVEISAEPPDLWVRIRDDAPPFEAGDVEKPHLDESLSERAYGGMGVYLIRKLTDGAEFQPLPGGGNELHLLKKNVVKDCESTPGRAVPGSE
jgi:serine/threonine-protein kinase RsbW